MPQSLYSLCLQSNYVTVAALEAQCVEINRERRVCSCYALHTQTKSAFQAMQESVYPKLQRLQAQLIETQVSLCRECLLQH